MGTSLRTYPLHPPFDLQQSLPSLLLNCPSGHGCFSPLATSPPLCGLHVKVSWLSLSPKSLVASPQAISQSFAMAQQAPCAPAIKCVCTELSWWGACLSCRGPWVPSTALGKAIPALRREMEVGGTKLQHHPHSKFKAGVGYQRPCPRKEKKMCMHMSTGAHSQGDTCRH